MNPDTLSIRVVRAADISVAERERVDALLEQAGGRGEVPDLRGADAGGWGTTQQQQPGYSLELLLAEQAGDATGAAAAAAASAELPGIAVVWRQGWRPEGVFGLHVAVLPQHRRQGIGTRLFDAAADVARSLGARRLLAEVSGGADETCLRFAAGRGFAVTQQFRTMILDIAAFDLSGFDRALARASARAGVRVFSFAEAGGDSGQNRRRLYELNRRLAPDLPGNGDEFPSFEEYTREIIEADWFRPEGQFIAAAGEGPEEQWVGLVGIAFDPRKRVASHEFTAVDRAFRGRGVAQALKLRSIGYAAALGARELVTGNDALNEAMLSINRKLGYREHLGATRLEKELR